MRLYSLSAIDNYLSALDENTDIITIPGCLIDNYIIIHSFCIEILKERYLNTQSSAIERHVFRKRVPKKYIEWLQNALSADFDIETKQDIADALMVVSEFNEKK